MMLWTITHRLGIWWNNISLLIAFWCFNSICMSQGISYVSHCIWLRNNLTTEINQNETSCCSFIFILALVFISLIQVWMHECQFVFVIISNQNFIEYYKYAGWSLKFYGINSNFRLICNNLSTKMRFYHFY